MCRDAGTYGRGLYKVSTKFIEEPIQQGCIEARRSENINHSGSLMITMKPVTMKADAIGQNVLTQSE